MSTYQIWNIGDPTDNSRAKLLGAQQGIVVDGPDQIETILITRRERSDHLLRDLAPADDQDTLLDTHAATGSLPQGMGNGPAGEEGGRCERGSPEQDAHLLRPGEEDEC